MWDSWPPIGSTTAPSSRHVTRALTKMKRAGLVEVGYRRLTILSRERLEKLQAET